MAEAEGLLNNSTLTASSKRKPPYPIVNFYKAGVFDNKTCCTAHPITGKVLYRSEKYNDATITMCSAHWRSTRSPTQFTPQMVPQRVLYSKVAYNVIEQPSDDPSLPKTFAMIHKASHGKPSGFHKQLGMLTLLPNGEYKFQKYSDGTCPLETQPRKRKKQ